MTKGSKCGVYLGEIYLCFSVWHSGEVHCTTTNTCPNISLSVKCKIDTHFKIFLFMLALSFGICNTPFRHLHLITQHFILFCHIFWLAVLSQHFMAAVTLEELLLSEAFAC